MKRLAVVVAVLAVALAGCDSTPPETPPTTTPTTTPATTASSPVRAATPPRPHPGQCYRLTYDQAVAPTTSKTAASCRPAFTARTFYVGTLDTQLDDHLLTVDSHRVQDAVAAQCTRRLPGYLHGDADAVALSMFRAIWFSPTVEQSDAGQDWYRCDVIALARDGELALLHGDMAGALAGDGLDRWGTCSTAEPGTATFARVSCASRHRWRAISVVRHGGADYPGAKALTADRDACEGPARKQASDPLKVVFSYLAPTRQQWGAGQHYGTCWVPTS